MAVEAVVSVIKEKLTRILNEKPMVFDKVLKDKVEPIQDTLNQGLLISAEGQEYQGEVKKYLPILYKLEDEIETFTLSITRQRMMKNNCTAAFFSYFNNLNARRKLQSKIKRIEIEIKQLNDTKPAERSTRSTATISTGSQQNGTFGSPHWNNIINHQRDQPEEAQQQPQKEEEEILGSSFGEDVSQRKLTESFSLEEKETGIFGIEKDKNTLVKKLTSDKGNVNESCSSNILSIIGQVGSGKTTLAHAIYKSKRIRDYFDCRAWVSVSKDYAETDLLLSLLKQLGSSEDQGVSNTEQLQNKLSELLRKKSCLVVIDHFHPCDFRDQLELVFKNTGNGSKMIMVRTTRDTDPSSPSTHDMKELNDEESWKMILKKVCSLENSTNTLQALEILKQRIPEIESLKQTYPKKKSLKQRILGICKGLPLRIVLLGGLISTKQVSYDEWSKVLDHIEKSIGCNGHDDALDILSFCYNDLSPHSKLCLLYLVLFPRECDIPVRRLVRLWVAEGFVKEAPEPQAKTAEVSNSQKKRKTAEDVALECFDDLVKRNMVQISKRRSDGSPRRCRLPSALHEKLRLKTQDIGLFHVHCNSDCTIKTSQFGLHRIIEYLDIKNCSLNFHELQFLRSYISFNIQKKDIPAGKVADFVSRIIGDRGFGLLGVLDLEGVYKPSLPNKLGDLFHLRYLGLRWTYLDNLPPSVGDLLDLETLDLKGTCINSLPTSIWKLKHLRHLNLNEICLDMPKQHHNPLPKLQTLWGLVVDDKSLVKNGLDRLRDLTELGITFNLSSSTDLANWIFSDSLTSTLQSLRLRSKDETGRPSELHLQSLSRMTELSHLNLLGNLKKLPDFPRGLKVLSLSVSMLTEDPMPTLGQLQSLTVLRLLANSYLGDKIVCSQNGFGKLEVLKLWMLKGLEEWEVKENAMLSLKELDIRCCDKLKTLPLSLLKQGTLEELTLTNMPDNFVEDTKATWTRRSEHSSLTVKKLKFTPLPWERDNYISDSVEGPSDNPKTC